MNACSQCGCNQYEVLRRTKRWWGEGDAEERRCDHCAHVWEANVDALPPADEAYGAVFIARLCPHCKSGNHRVTRTMPGGVVRYHQCGECGKNFRSTERAPAK